MQHLKFLVFILIIVTVILGVKLSGFESYFTKGNLRENALKIRTFVEANYEISIVVYILTYAVVASAMPVAFIMILAGGLFYGMFEGTFYALIAVALSAMGTFTFSRYFAGRWIQRRFADKLETFNRQFHKNGTWYLISVRIVPIAPFCVLNLLAGLTQVKLPTFLWTTCLGSVPGVLLISFIGDTVFLVRP